MLTIYFTYYIQVFHVYMAGTEGPVVFCLHGGGYSGYANAFLLDGFTYYSVKVFFLHCQSIITVISLKM